MAMILTLILPKLEMEQPLEMHPWNYPTWGLDYPTETFFSNHHQGADWPTFYENQLVSPSSFGTRCIPGNTIRYIHSSAIISYVITKTHCVIKEPL